LISQGLLDGARQLAQSNTDRLYPLAEQGRPLVFFEPSCLSAIVEDVPSLLRGEAQGRARVIAAGAVLFEEFVEAECQAERARLQLAKGPSQVLLHGHCHQKSMGRVAAATALLSRIPGAKVVDLDTGCCGMAGSFGYTRDHYEVSRAIGERRLLPVARNVDANTVLLASGVSCRHQIADFAGTRAVHAAELLKSLIRESA
jgi:Fe-S oxidoreductase